MAYNKKKIKAEYDIFAKQYARKKLKTGVILMIGTMIEN